MYRIYGFDTCPYCQKAYSLLLLNDIDFESYTIPEKESRTAFLDSRGFTGSDRTFPRIYDVTSGEEVLVGGFTELEAKINANL